MTIRGFQLFAAGAILTLIGVCMGYRLGYNAGYQALARNVVSAAKGGACYWPSSEPLPPDAVCIQSLGLDPLK